MRQASLQKLRKVYKNLNNFHPDLAVGNTDWDSRSKALTKLLSAAFSKVDGLVAEANLLHNALPGPLKVETENVGDVAAAAAGNDNGLASASSSGTQDVVPPGGAEAACSQPLGTPEKLMGRLDSCGSDAEFKKIIDSVVVAGVSKEEMAKKRADVLDLIDLFQGTPRQDDDAEEGEPAPNGGEETALLHGVKVLVQNMTDKELLQFVEDSVRGHFFVNMKGEECSAKTGEEWATVFTKLGFGERAWQYVDHALNIQTELQREQQDQQMKDLQTFQGYLPTSGGFFPLFNELEEKDDSSFSKMFAGDSDETALSYSTEEDALMNSRGNEPSPSSEQKQPIIMNRDDIAAIQFDINEQVHSERSSRGGGGLAVCLTESEVALARLTEQQAESIEDAQYVTRAYQTYLKARAATDRRAQRQELAIRCRVQQQEQRDKLIAISKAKFEENSNCENSQGMLDKMDIIGNLGESTMPDEEPAANDLNDGDMEMEDQKKSLSDANEFTGVNMLGALATAAKIVAPKKDSPKDSLSQQLQAADAFYREEPGGAAKENRLDASKDDPTPASVVVADEETKPTTVPQAGQFRNVHAYSQPAEVQKLGQLFRVFGWLDFYATVAHFLDDNLRLITMKERLSTKFTRLQVHMTESAKEISSSSAGGGGPTNLLSSHNAKALTTSKTYLPTKMQIYNQELEAIYHAIMDDANQLHLFGLRGQLEGIRVSGPTASELFKLPPESQVQWRIQAIRQSPAGRIRAQFEPDPRMGPQNLGWGLAEENRITAEARAVSLQRVVPNFQFSQFAVRGFLPYGSMKLSRFFEERILAQEIKKITHDTVVPCYSDEKTGKPVPFEEISKWHALIYTWRVYVGGLLWPTDALQENMQKELMKQFENIGSGRGGRGNAGGNSQKNNFPAKQRVFFNKIKLAYNEFLQKPLEAFSGNSASSVISAGEPVDKKSPSLSNADKKTPITMANDDTIFQQGLAGDTYALLTFVRALLQNDSLLRENLQNEISQELLKSSGSATSSKKKKKKKASQTSVVVKDVTQTCDGGPVTPETKNLLLDKTIDELEAMTPSTAVGGPSECSPNGFSECSLSSPLSEPPASSPSKKDAAAAPGFDIPNSAVLNEWNAAVHGSAGSREPTEDKTRGSSVGPDGKAKTEVLWGIETFDPTADSAYLMDLQLANNAVVHYDFVSLQPGPLPTLIAENNSKRTLTADDEMTKEETGEGPDVDMTAAEGSASPTNTGGLTVSTTTNKCPAGFSFIKTEKDCMDAVNALNDSHVVWAHDRSMVKIAVPRVYRGMVKDENYPEGCFWITPWARDFAPKDAGVMFNAFDFASSPRRERERGDASNSQQKGEKLKAPRDVSYSFERNEMKAPRGVLDISFERNDEFDISKTSNKRKEESEKTALCKRDVSNPEHLIFTNPPNSSSEEGLLSVVDQKSYYFLPMTGLQAHVENGEKEAMTAAKVGINNLSRALFSVEEKKNSNEKKLGAKELGIFAGALKHKLQQVMTAPYKEMRRVRGFNAAISSGGV